MQVVQACLPLSPPAQVPLLRPPGTERTGCQLIGEEVCDSAVSIIDRGHLEAWMGRKVSREDEQMASQVLSEGCTLPFGK